MTFILVYFPIKHKIVRDGFRLLESKALANREKQLFLVGILFGMWNPDVSRSHHFIAGSPAMCIISAPYTFHT